MSTAGKTKKAQCAGCGTEVTVSLFMSAAKARCEQCKNGKPGSTDESGMKILVGPRIDGQPNKALRRLCCPYHPSEVMSIIGVSKNEQRGDIVSFQCRIDGCWTLVKISEQTRCAVKTTASGLGYEPDDVLQRYPRTNPNQEERIE